MAIFRGKVRAIHFVGIGGSGMSSMAEILLEFGFNVTGSDLKESETIQHLRRLGARVAIGHRAENLESVDVVVYSSAAKQDNVELASARERHIPVIPRAEMLAELMRLKLGVAVAGSHGKTTTTSLVTVILREAGLDPSAVIGGRVKSLGSGAIFGHGDVLVAEADESDGSFLKLTPTIAVITNIDAEHMDHYRDLATLERAFFDFASRVPFYGLVVGCSDHPVVDRLMAGLQRRYVSYGLNSNAHYQAIDLEFDALKTTFELRKRGASLGRWQLALPGEHNVLNALAAVAVSEELGVDSERAKVALERFSGVERRFNVLGSGRGVTVVDDYGHHPTEIEATLKAAKRLAGAGRLFVIFQPHRYSRTKLLESELCEALSLADGLILTDIYAADEQPLNGISSLVLLERIRSLGHKWVFHSGDMGEAGKLAVHEAKTGDVVLTLGAGSITQLAPKVLEALSSH